MQLETIKHRLSVYRLSIFRPITLCLVIILTFQLLQCSFAQTPFEGKASWYGPGFAGNRTANGEIYDPSQLTAAHPTLEFGTLLRVTNLANGLSVDVRINDRGPYIGNRVIDLSQAAAAQIDMERSGIGTIRAEFISELGELDFPATASYSTEISSALTKFEVIHPDYSHGTLLLAYSNKLDEPVLVRVIEPTIETMDEEKNPDTLLVSESLYSEIGEVVKIYSEAANTDN